MLRIRIDYNSGKPHLAITNEFDTISDFEKKWLSESANNIMIRAPEGGALISKKNVEKVTVDLLDNNGNSIERKIYIGSELIYSSEVNEMPEEAIVMEETQMPLETAEIVVNDEDVSNEEIETVTEIPVESPVVIDVGDIVVSDTQSTVEDTTSIPVKSQNFREKFLDREKRADAFENSIIEKMDRRIERLKNFEEVLDNENAYLEDFKAEKLG